MMLRIIVEIILKDAKLENHFSIVVCLWWQGGSEAEKVLGNVANGYYLQREGSEKEKMLHCF